MIQLTAKQVEWLVFNKQFTPHTIQTPIDSNIHGLLTRKDIFISKDTNYTYYLTPEVYNSLPTEFKQLEE